MTAIACGSDTTLVEAASGGPSSPPPVDPGFSAVGALRLPGQLELPVSWRLAPAFPGLTFDDPVSLQQAPRTQYLVVSEREGRLYAFERRPDVTRKILMLDLSAHNQGENDSGLLGIAFHPDFAQPDSPHRGYLYVHYAHREDPIVGSTPPVFTATRSRLSRFNVNLQTFVADPASELVLIDQDDESVWHQGGAMFFHPRDGFLYLTVGDEGARDCVLGNCQRIDQDLFSGVLRLDVDQRGGDVSHPIPRQPRHGRTANYYIPSDNPFVGRPGVLEEFFALGLRSPHRMTHDPVDDVVWIGDVGQEASEELDVLAPGANFQWNVFEGTLRSKGAAPAPPLGVWTEPVLELDHNEAVALIGGYVYRGRRLPALQGKYIFADFTLGRVFALDYELTADGRVIAADYDELLTAEFQAREDGITSFGVDEEGELYVLTLGAASLIQRLEPAEPRLNVPTTLSQVGVFRDVIELEPESGFVSYDVQNPLWSDGADKQRWLRVPEDGYLDFTPEGPWQFPVGTVFMKHFEMTLDERRPLERTRLETRLLVAGADGYYGVSYKWNAEGTDATLVPDDLLETLEVTLADGSRRVQLYSYPGPSECLVCHNEYAEHVLGVRTAQLSAELVNDWAASGLFSAPPEPEAVADAPRLAFIADEAHSLEQRVRSYWDANCSMCHGVRPFIAAQWDARIQTPLGEQNVIDAVAVNLGLDGATLLIEPGHPQRSILFQRSAALDAFRMPPLGTHRTDGVYLDVLERWIRSLDH